jgi:uncharacterized protein YgiB involved in biofilm formation
MPAISVANAAGLFSTDPSPTEAAALKVVVVLLIAGVVGVMVFMAWRGECPGGSVVFSESQCRQSGSFDAAVCGLIFRSADDVAQRANTTYSNQQACQVDYERCTPSGINQGFTPVPAGFCVSAKGGSIVRQEPVYRRINAAHVGSRP